MKHPKRKDNPDTAHTGYLHLVRGKRARLYCGPCHKKAGGQACQGLATVEKQCLRMEQGQCDVCGRKI